MCYFYLFDPNTAPLICLPLVYTYVCVYICITYICTSLIPSLIVLYKPFLLLSQSPSVSLCFSGSPISLPIWFVDSHLLFCLFSKYSFRSSRTVTSERERTNNLFNSILVHTNLDLCFRLLLFLHIYYLLFMHVQV